MWAYCGLYIPSAAGHWVGPAASTVEAHLHSRILMQL